MTLPTLMVPGAFSAQANFDLSVLGNTVGFPAQRQFFSLLPLSGLTGSGATLVLEYTTDASGTTWAAVAAIGYTSGVSSSSVTVDDTYKVPSANVTFFRWRVTTAGTRSIAVFNGGGSQPQDVNVVGGSAGGGGGGTASSVTLLAGSAVVGAVTQSGGPWAVADSTAESLLASIVSGVATAAKQPALNGDGGSLAHVTNFPTTQPISATGLPLPAGAAVASLQPPINADGGAQVHVTNFPAALTAQYNTTPPLYTNGQTTQLQTDANGRALVNITSLPGTGYKTVAASLTAQTLGTTGATGDLLNGILVIPATTAPGIVTILDNATSIVAFPGGTLSSVIPFFISLGVTSVNGPWKVTTGANVSVVAMGKFT